MKKNGNNFINLHSELASGTYYLNTDFEFNQGDEIYIGYLNGNGTGSYEFTIERAISNSFHLVTDIDNLHTVGSEVRLNNGSYGGTSIMQGFTRVCINHTNNPGIIAKFTNEISSKGANIESLVSQSKGEYAYTILDLDKKVDTKALAGLDGVLRVRVI